MDFDSISHETLTKLDYELEIWEREFSDALYDKYDEKYPGKKEVWEELFNMNYDKFWWDIYRANKKILYDNMVRNLEEFYNKIMEGRENLELKID